MANLSPRSFLEAAVNALYGAVVAPQTWASALRRFALATNFGGYFLYRRDLARALLQLAVSPAVYEFIDAYVKEGWFQFAPRAAIFDCYLAEESQNGLLPAVRSIAGWPVRPATFVAFAAGLVIAFGSPGPIHAEATANVTILQPKVALHGAQRLALVVGNSGYRNVPTLKNPTNDATAVAEKLQGLGYRVHLAEDLDRLNFNEAVAAFLQNIEPGMETLVYYAGHGVELGGSNYLLPVDVPELAPGQEYLLRTEGINLTDLLIELQDRSARVTLVILDACRDNPFRIAGAPAGTRSLGALRGLGRVDPPSGTFVIFSAGVGEQALDNLGSADKNPNGLFTRNLLTLMDRQGLEIRSMVQQLRAQVRQAALTGGQSQTPSYYDQLLGEFYFRPGAAEPDTVAPPPQLAPNQVATLPVEPPAATANPENDAGTELTESAIRLNRQEKIDLQERLLAIGYDLDEADGDFGIKTRRAIGKWQEDNRLPPATFLTRKQYLRLKLDTNDAVDSYRARRASEAEAKKQAAERKKPQITTSQKSRKPTVHAKPKRPPAAESTADSAVPSPVTRQPKFRTCGGRQGFFQIPASQKCPQAWSNVSDNP
ncbi:caspase family protein [Mesorhizobium sp. URHB0026]